MKLSTILILLAIAVGLIIVVTSIEDSSSYETFQVALENPEKEYHIVGELVLHEKMEYDPVENPNLFKFFLKDQDGEIVQVLYDDTKPRDFERSEQVVIIGKMENEYFHASQILTKCPSKYVDDEIEVANS